MVKTCEHCGSVLEERQFHSSFQQDIYDYIRRHPDCTRESIADYVYRNDPDGGAGSNSIAVVIGRMRKQLKGEGFNIVTRSGPGATYRLVKDSPE